jgi:hypothetical protein
VKPPTASGSEQPQEGDLEVTRLELKSSKMQLKSVHLRLSRTQQDLEVTRRQKSELEAMVSELPEIFERKFKERCAPILERQRLLIEENQWLRQTLQHVLPGFNPQQRALMPGPGTTPAPAPPPAPSPEAAAKPADAPAKPRTSPGTRRSLSWPKRPLTGGRALPHTQRQLLLVGGLVGLLSLGGTLGYQQLQRASSASPADTAAGATQKQGASSPGAAAASPATAKALGANEVALVSNQENWVEVRNGAGTYLFVGLLKGEKRFALNKGLQVFAGRPDLLTIQQGKGPARQLGQVSDVTWVTIQPEGAASGSGPASSGAAPASR